MLDEKNEKKKEEILDQEIELDELDSVVGGIPICQYAGYNDDPNPQKKEDNCTEDHYRSIYLGGFANCAATVEDGSWCATNDACYSGAVDYQGTIECKKAWR